MTATAPTAASPPHRHRRETHPRLHAATVAVTVVLCALAGGWLGIVVAGQTDQSIGPFDAHVSLHLSTSGDTDVQLPPLGTLTVDSHDGPLGLSVRITQIRDEDARAIVADPAVLERLGDDVARDLRTAVITLVLRAGLGALLGAAVVTLLVLRRTRRAAAAVAVALVTLAGSALTAATTFNRDALAEPTYTGVLASAPALVGNVQDIVTRFDTYGRQLAGLVDNVTQLYGAASTLPVFAGDSDVIRLLHVSDIHSNPAAYEVIGQVVRQFGIDAVVDSGDITDHGSSLENGLLAPIGELGVPYAYVRGNHDSAATQAALGVLPGVVVLDGAPKTVAGLTMLGLGDPLFTPDIDARGTPEQEKAAITAAARDLATVAAAMPTRPDVVMVHEPKMAADVLGTVPLVLSGHGHRRQREDRDGTLFRQEGSTGGAGLRGLEGEEPTPLMASVLYLDRTTHELLAYDDITLGGLGLSSATIERHLVGEAAAAVEESPSPTPVPSPSLPPSPSPTSLPSPSPAPGPSGSAGTPGVDPSPRPTPSSG